MRSKNIISTIAFITAFAFSAAFASLFITESQTNFQTYEIRNDRSSNCRSIDKTCTDISALLIQDIRNGDQRRSRYDYSLGDKRKCFRPPRRNGCRLFGRFEQYGRRAFAVGFPRGVARTYESVARLFGIFNRSQPE